MKKQISIFVLVTALLLLFSVDPVWAGSRARYRWEGVAIGLGAAIIGSALIHCYGWFSTIGRQFVTFLLLFMLGRL
ncbi:MAG: hypothetical protein JRF37_11025 [Deltaproteobacteria bacterium]|nr:hypothetical protein [Deltaproteobacteria bacterium]